MEIYDRLEQKRQKPAFSDPLYASRFLTKFILAKIPNPRLDWIINRVSPDELTDIREGYIVYIALFVRRPINVQILEPLYKARKQAPPFLQHVITEVWEKEWWKKGPM